MKLVHSNLGGDSIDMNQPIAALLKNGRQWEIENPAKAAELYKKMIRIYPHKAEIYDRLMMLYRKEKNCKKELDLITQSIKLFQELHDKTFSRKANQKITQLSKAISRATGLHDSKNKPLIPLPEPLAKWNRRKTNLLKKMKSL